MPSSIATGRSRAPCVRASGGRRFACATVGALSLALVGCNGQEKDAIDVTGRWQSEIDQSVMSIEESGLFAMDVPGERLPIIGTVSINGTQITFINRPETRLCVGDEGIYEVVIDDDRLRTTVVRDTCPSRVLHMSRPWRRLSADQNPDQAPE